MMSDKDSKAAEGGALWRRARESSLEGLAAPAQAIDENDLAAYLEGELDAAERARIEAVLARRPEALDLLIGAREALDAEPAAMPQAFEARAQALVPARKSLAARLAEGLAAVLDLTRRPARGLAFAGVAAGFMMISVAGFELGRAEVDFSTQIDGLLAQDFLGLIERGGEDFL